MTQSATRTEAAALADAARFDWPAHNAKLDAALAAYDQAERDLAEAHLSVARDLHAIIGEIGK